MRRKRPTRKAEALSLVRMKGRDIGGGGGRLHHRGKTDTVGPKLPASVSKGGGEKQLIQQKGLHGLRCVSD